MEENPMSSNEIRLHHITLSKPRIGGPSATQKKVQMQYELSEVIFNQRLGRDPICEVDGPIPVPGSDVQRRDLNSTHMVHDVASKLEPIFEEKEKSHCKIVRINITTGRSTVTTNQPKNFEKTPYEVLAKRIQKS
ncbi:hypothetical protein ACTXT7_003582 [Hymenolepis weldensis]